MNKSSEKVKMKERGMLSLGTARRYSKLSKWEFLEELSVRGMPHIHVRYQGDEAVILIDDGNILDGSIPPKQLRMVQAWIEIHKEELMVDWELAVNGEEPFRIAPLQ